MILTEPELLDMIAAEAIVDRKTLVREATLADVGVSSLDLISLLFELEERYSVAIEGEDMPPIKNLGELVDFLLGRINAEGKAA